MTMENVAVGYKRLFSPLKIANFEIRNRIVNTTHHAALPKDRELAYLRARARGGAALFGINGGLGVGNYGVGPGEPGSVADWDRNAPSGLTPAGIKLYDDLVIPGLADRAALLHAEGAKCFAQVNHVGAGQHWPMLRAVIGPSNVPDTYDALVPHGLTEEEIEELIFLFAQGIRRICEAGMDAAELHCAHGYLIMQFFSPHFNCRTDRWGGSRENRMRFVLAVIDAARKLVGSDFPIGIRVGYEGDGVSRGLTIAELAEICALLSEHVAYVSVSGGSYSGLHDGFDGAYVSPWYREPAFNAEACSAIRQRVDVPVLITGRIADGAIAEALLADGTADMVGMVRALIADPDLPNKMRSGKADEVRMCLGMSECHHIGRFRVPMTCAVNAAAGREEELTLEPAPEPKTVVIVGAGPAGLEAARVAATRGHKVYLCDEEKRIGGTIRWLANDANRRNLLDHTVYYERILTDLNVELVLGHRVTAEDVRGFEAHAVVVATGARPLVPDVPGIGGASILTAEAVFRGAALPTGPILVVGGLDTHLAGPTVAELLADRGHEVILINEQVDFAAAAEDGTRFTILDRLKRKRVQIVMCRRLVGIDGGAALTVDTFGARDVHRLTAVSIVLACGLLPNDEIYRQLKGDIAELHLIGDAIAPRRLMHATVEGARVGLAI